MSKEEKQLHDGLHDLAGAVEPQVDLGAVIREGDLLKRARRVRWSLAGAAGMVCAALIIVPQIAAAPVPAVPQPATTAPTSPAPTTAQPTSTPGPAELTVLTCNDMYTTSPDGTGSNEFTASGVKFLFLGESGSNPYPIEDAGFPRNPGGYYSKSPVYLADGVTWAVITLLEGDATLAWTDSFSPWDLSDFEATTVRLESCDGSFTGFLGGVRTPQATGCLILGISSNLHPEVERFPVTIGEEPCPIATPTASTSDEPDSTPSPAALRELTCVDAYTVEPRGTQPAFTSSGVGFVGLNEVGYDPLRTEDAGFPLDKGGYVTKSHLYLDDGVAWAEVSVLDGDLTLAWAPAGVWTGLSGQSPWSLAAYEAHAVRFESCGGGYTGFLGVLRSPTARECVTLGIRSNLHPEVEPVRVAIGKDACR